MLYRRLTVEDMDYEAEYIERQRLFNVFVFGVARSGTSMMAGIVERLGVKMVHTSDTAEELAKRKDNEARRYGSGYEMNPDGFYEITRDAWDHLDEIKRTPYSGCKMIVPVRPDRMHVVTYNPCVKVILMWRDPEEVRQSQQAAYDGEALVDEEQAEDRRAVIRMKLANQKTKLDKLGIATLHVKYRDVLNDPALVVGEVARFIHAQGGIQEAIEWVDASKNRFKVEELELSI